MELSIIRLKVCLLFVFCSLSWFAVAQTSNDNDKELLLGKWINEEGNVFDTERTIYLDPGNSYIEFYAEIEVKKDSMLLKNKTTYEETQKVKYEVDGNYLGFDLPSGETFITEWAIFEDKLYLEFSTYHPFGAPRKVNVLLVYRRDK